ncbi:MAG: DMT family transporter, partial [Burkholderiales bacterium]|nr:DMT family transporter [Burkholderiales bacterium]
LWGTTGTIKSFAPEGVSPFLITFIRMSMGAVLLFLLCLLTHKWPKSLKGINWLAICGFAGGLLGFQFFFFGSVSEVGVAVCSVISIGATPIWTAILQKVLYGRNPKNYWYPSAALAILGTVLLNIDNIGSGVDWLFIAFPLLASLSYAIELIFSERAMQGIEPEIAVVLAMGIISLICLPTLFLSPLNWMFTYSGMWVCLAFGILSSALPFPLFFAGIKITNPLMGSMMGMAEPTTAALLGIFFLHEHFDLAVGIGIIFVLLSIALMIWGSATHR